MNYAKKEYCPARQKRRSHRLCFLDMREQVRCGIAMQHTLSMLLARFCIEAWPITRASRAVDYHGDSTLTKHS